MVSWLMQAKKRCPEFMSRWDTDWASHNVSLKTGERYRQLITNQIKPHLGQTKTGLRFKSPKTQARTADHCYSAGVVADLRAHWKAAQEQRLALGLGRSAPNDLVFTMSGRGRRANRMHSLTTGYERAQ